MIKGLAITPPVLGRISIGKMVEKNGKRLPEKDDQFTVTSQVQSREGWVLHPLDEVLRKAADNNKIRSIPIRVMFDDPDSEYSLFNKTSGRPVCVGNGETCRRYTPEGLQSLPCPTPDGCDLGESGCKPYGRLNVVIGGEDELGSFIFRTTGYNSIRTLTARLSYFKAVSGNLLSCLPLEMKLRAKSTTQSHRAPVYYVDLTVREGMTLEAAISEAKQTDALRRASGYDQVALDAAARAGFANGAFEDSQEEIPEIVEEFFGESGDGSGLAGGEDKSTLLDKLEKKAGASNLDAYRSKPKEEVLVTAVKEQQLCS